mmetsp:Transcript_16260/g.36711  ORF Transcript_16260/g.36711 Transcript_16260/m.36711 type:complete len:154 (+) Transcript_16260:3-464(+)
MPAHGTEVEITSGVAASTTRKTLKQELEKYGEIEICHMGDRHRPEVQLPWARFAKQAGAEAALEALRGGQVFVDGMLLKGEPRSDKSRPPPKELEERASAGGGLTSRELFLQGRGGGGGDRGGKRSRSRDRRRRSRSGERKRRSGSPRRRRRD